MISLAPRSGERVGERGGRTRCQRVQAESEAVHLGLHEVRQEVPVAALGDPRVRVAEQALHRDEVRAEHEEHTPIRVPHVVKADVADLPGRPELHRALRARAQRRVRALLAVAAPLPTADVLVAGDDLGALERAAQDVLRLPELRPRRPIGVREEPHPWPRLECVGQERDQLLGDAHDTLPLALRERPRVAAAHREEPASPC